MFAKPKRTLALLVAGLFCLSGCSRGTQVSPDEMNIILPEPEPHKEEQILGDKTSSVAHEVTFYYAPESNLELASMTRPVIVEPEESLVRNVVLELLSSELTGTQGVSVPEARLIDVEYGCGAVTVNLSLEAGTRQNDQDALLLRAAIANTLLGIDGVSAVNILTGSRSDAICALPSGAYVQPVENVPAVYAQLQSEQDRFQGSNSAAIARNVLLYFPAGDKAHLLPELRELRFETEDYASVILAALTSGPLENNECCFSAIPANLELLPKEPELRITEAGERVIELDFTAMLPNYLALSGIEPWQLYGSIVLSLCSFMPELDAVRISIEGEAVDSCNIIGMQLSFEEGFMRRSDFSPQIGASATLYFTNEFGVLNHRECALSQAGATSAKGILTAMISTGNPGVEGLKSIFPEGVYAGDILGVSVENRIATVNLSGNFYARCQGMEAQDERNLIYGMINAISELPEIGAVRFLVEGMGVETLAQDIYLGTALMPDPGIGQNDSFPLPMEPTAE